MSKEDAQKFDIFIRNSIYPEAEGIFSFRPKSLSKIKDNCLIVLDTNALLVPYLTGKDSLEQIGKIYRKLVQAKRLIVPGQVAREFAEHRVTKIKELYQQISRKKSTKLSLGNYPLLDQVSEYQKAHELEKNINKLIDEYSKTVTSITDIISNWYWDDPVSELYGELFAVDVVLDPTFDNEELKERLEKDIFYKLPPGYKDAGKEDRGIGDLLVWQTILEIAKIHKTSVIFVSLDQKTDWHSQCEGRSLYPRYELIDEFRRASQGQSLHIIKFSGFLNLYGATEAVIEEVRKEEEQSIIESAEPPDEVIIQSSMHLSRGVFEWLQRQHPGRVCISEINDQVDFVITNLDGTLTGVECKHIQSLERVKIKLERVLLQLQKVCERGDFRRILLILFSKQIPVILELDSLVLELQASALNVSIIIGFMGENEAFRPLDPTMLSSLRFT